MFIREKSKKVNGKKRYIQHQLIESIRTPSGPRQQIVLNLGRLCLPEEKWKALANCIAAAYGVGRGIWSCILGDREMPFPIISRSISAKKLNIALSLDGGDIINQLAVQTV